MAVVLPAGTATEAGGTVYAPTGRGSNDGNTRTGGVLVGGQAADTIAGGPGRGARVGGKEADAVAGGSAEDMVVGSTG